MARSTSARLGSLVQSPFVRAAERGQVMMMSILLLPILLGMVGMAIDIGTYADHRRHLQNSADAAALAGSHDLPNTSTATAAALTWGAANNIDPTHMTITVTQVSGSNPNPLIRVEIEDPHTFAFMRVLGINSKNVSARATAMKTSPGGVGSVVPWAITENTFLASDSGDVVTLKYDATNVQSGNFGAIRIDGSGSSVYEDSITDGTDSYICADTVTTCSETSPTCDASSVCQTEAGNKVSGTRDGVDWRIAHTDNHCDTFGEAFSGPVSDKYVLESSCNPWTDGGYESNRVIIVPIIKALCNGSCSVTVVKFAMFFLEGYGTGKCSGNNCEIKGRFVNADANINALAGVYDEDSGLVFTRLSE